MSSFFSSLCAHHLPPFIPPSLSVLSFIPLSFLSRSFSCYLLVTQPPLPFLSYGFYQTVISSLSPSTSLFLCIPSFCNVKIVVLPSWLNHPSLVFFISWSLTLTSIFPSSLEVQCCFVILPFPSLHPSLSPLVFLQYLFPIHCSPSLDPAWSLR